VKLDCGRACVLVIAMSQTVLAGRGPAVVALTVRKHRKESGGHEIVVNGS
jgi:hypothetical protein